jgi:hypothetical protein
MQYVKRPHKGDVIRTESYGDVTVATVIGYGTHLLVTDAAGEERHLERGSDDQWLRVARAT